jgi:hypothetical protein
LTPIIEQFASRLAQTVEQFTISRIETAIRASGSTLRGKSAGNGGHASRAQVLCYYPGCKNIAAPRFSMFCAALHKSISKSEKEKYRALHAKHEPKALPAAAKRGRRRKSS